MITYMLDTDICIYVIKKRPQKVFDRFVQCKIGQIALSTISYAELQFGVQNSSDPESNAVTLNKFLGPIEVLDFTAEAAVVYGDIRATLKKDGNIIGANDLLISAHAIACNYTLVTNNIREYQRVPKLDYENWA